MTNDEWGRAAGPIGLPTGVRGADMPGKRRVIRVAIRHSSFVICDW
jgi:hypothetical protein